MKKMLWIGSYLDEKTNQIMISQGYKNAASYVSQKNLLEGIEANIGCTFDSINTISMAGYPKQGGGCVKSYSYSHALGARDLLVGYINPLYLNKLFMEKAMIKGAKSWIKERYTSGDDLEIFIYEMRSACLAAAVYIKTRIPTAKIHLIIPDLPCFMDLNMSKIKRILKKVDWNNMINKFSFVDDYILYTETMVDFLKIRDKKWMVMEGSINQGEISKIINEIDNRRKKVDKKVIMYSGWIDQSFGIDELIDAMEYLDDSYELWITGGGPYERNLKIKTEKNKKVKYYGFIPTREKLLDLQAQATVMVNIRNPLLEAVHYCFPSKLFEYMLLGIPVLSVKLGGIPEEYKKFLFEFEELKGEKIAVAIENLMKDKDKDKKAMAGRKFVAEKKNNLIMTRKIIEFIEG